MKSKIIRLFDIAFQSTVPMDNSVKSWCVYVNNGTYQQITMIGEPAQQQ